MPDADVSHVLEASCAGFLLALSMYTCACVRLVVATIGVLKTSVEKGVVRLCGSVAEHLSCKQKVIRFDPGRRHAILRCYSTRLGATDAHATRKQCLLLRFHSEDIPPRQC